ncbi:MAG: sugar ABC transporter permease [Paracoccaceae bacterium]
MAQLWTALFTIVIGIFGAVLWFWGANWVLDRLLPVRGPDPVRNSRNIQAASLVRPWLFLGPAVLALTLYLVYPVVASLWLSFHDKSGQAFVGGANYAWLLSDPGFHEAIVNNFLWLLFVPAASTFLGLLAAALTDRIKWGNFAKSLIFMPMAISFVGAAVIWKFVYDYRAGGSDQIGILNAIVTWFGGDPQAWITIPFWNNFFLMIILVWIQTGFAMVILSAALRGIPEETIEAAVLDGASGIQIFFKIMVPQIWGTIAVVWTTITITVLKVFDIVLAMTNGQWNSNVLANLMFDWMFRGGGDFGRGATIAIVIMILVIPIMVWNIRNAREEMKGR